MAPAPVALRLVGRSVWAVRCYVVRENRYHSQADGHSRGVHRFPGLRASFVSVLSRQDEAGACHHPGYYRIDRFGYWSAIRFS